MNGSPVVVTELTDSSNCRICGKTNDCAQEVAKATESLIIGLLCFSHRNKSNDESLLIAMNKVQNKYP